MPTRPRTTGSTTRCMPASWIPSRRACCGATASWRGRRRAKTALGWLSELEQRPVSAVHHLQSGSAVLPGHPGQPDQGQRHAGVRHRQSSESPDWPDSVRIVIGNRQECYRFGVSTGCASTDGNYWDNVSLAIVDGDPQPIQAQIWDLYQDTFPANEGLGLPGVASAFDTTSALIKSGPQHRSAREPDPLRRSWRLGGDHDERRRQHARRPGVPYSSGAGQLRHPRSSGPEHAAQAAELDDSDRRSVVGVLELLGELPREQRPEGHAGRTCRWRLESERVELRAYGYGRSRDLLLPGPRHRRRSRCGERGSRARITSPSWASLRIRTPKRADDPYPVTNIRAALGIPRSRCFVAAAGAATTDVQCNGAVPAYVGTAGVPNPLDGLRWHGDDRSRTRRSFRTAS